jgi:large subunit ribosomal protein L24
MNIKKGDKVKVLAGKDRGKTSEVLQVFPDRMRASVDGANMLVKHLRPRRQGEKGQRIEFPAPMHVSNLMLVCPKCGAASRTGHKTMEVAGRQKKYRVCKKCGQTIE